MPVEMPAPIVMPAPQVLVGSDARIVMEVPKPMPATECVIIGQAADGQIGWVLTPKSWPVPPVWTVPVSAPGIPERMLNVRPAYHQAPAVRLVQRS